MPGLTVGKSVGDATRRVQEMLLLSLIRRMNNKEELQRTHGSMVQSVSCLLQLPLPLPVLLQLCIVIVIVRQAKPPSALSF